MKNVFSNIWKFIDFRDKCVFCGSKLSPVFTSFVIRREIPTFKSRLVDNYFLFSLKNVNRHSIVDVKCKLNILSNELFIEKQPAHTSSGNNTIELFEMHKPHISLSCDNKKCGLNYTVNSNFITCDRLSNKYVGTDFIEYTTIRPFFMYFDSINIGKYWVQSDYIYNTTRIVSNKNPDGDPIETPFINFELFNKDKIKNRILTVVTFT